MKKKEAIMIQSGKSKTRGKKKRLKKFYVKPELIKYGTVEKLTETGGSKRNDIGPQSRP